MQHNSIAILQQKEDVYAQQQEGGCPKRNKHALMLVINPPDLAKWLLGVYKTISLNEEEYDRVVLCVPMLTPLCRYDAKERNKSLSATLHSVIRSSFYLYFPMPVFYGVHRSIGLHFTLTIPAILHKVYCSFLVY